MNEEAKNELLAELNKLRLQVNFIDQQISLGQMSSLEYWDHKERIVYTLDNIDHLLGNDVKKAVNPYMEEMKKLVDDFCGEAEKYIVKRGEYEH